jgi:hypothetical protein
MQIVMDPQEEAAVQRYADKHGLTYGEAFQRMLDAMTKGLLDLAREDGEFQETTKVD